MKHKHAEVIKAWADGAEIQIRCEKHDWEDLETNYPKWSHKYEYRIKPEPQEREPQYLYIYRDTSNNISVYHAMMVEAFNNFYYMGKVRVEK